MSLLLRKNIQVTTSRQFSSKKFMLDSFYKPVSHVTLTILLGIYDPELKLQNKINTQTENSLFSQ